MLGYEQIQEICVKIYHRKWKNIVSRLAHLFHYYNDENQWFAVLKSKYNVQSLSATKLNEIMAILNWVLTF